MPFEQIDHSTPRDILEESEELPEASHDELATVVGRILAWILEGGTLGTVGLRAYILAHKIRPDLIGGMSLDKMAAKLGHGRSSAHKLSKDLSAVFGIRGINDRSETARQKYREAWARTHGTPLPHSYRPQNYDQSTNTRANGARSGNPRACATGAAGR